VEYILKPFAPMDLTDRVAKILEKYSSTQGEAASDPAQD
jgi:DNA-binding response OmpR family regulator